MTTNERLLLSAVLFVGLVTRPVFGDTKPDAVPPLIPPPPLAAPATPDTNPPVLPPPVAPAPEAPAAPAVTEMAPPAKPAAHAKKKSTKSTKAKSTKTASKTSTKTAAKKAAPKVPEMSVPLNPGPATVTAKRVNLRGKPTIASEVLGRLTNSEPVTVIEEIRRDNKRPDDPDVWAKIALPATTHAWVFGSFIDSNKTVSVKKLNVRGGPGENFSVVGMMKKGDAVTVINEKEKWLEITPPADAYVYVAAAYLRQEAPMVPVEAPAAAPTPESTAVTPGTPIAGAPTEAPATPASVEPPTAPAPDSALTASPAMPAPNLPVVLDPSIKRIVDREGVVRRTWSIQAPSDYRLVSPDTGESIVYLHTSSTNLDLSRYKGLHIIVTGEEGMDRRWKNVPVLTIRRIQVIE